MDMFTQQRFTIWAIGLLIALNLATLSFFWINRNQETATAPPPQAGRDPNGVRGFLEKELHLTASQLTRFDALQAKHAAQGQRLEEEIHEYRRRMMDQLASPQPDLALVDQLASAIGNRQAMLDKATFRHILDIKAMCTPDQQAKLSEIFREVLRTIRPPGPANRPNQPRAGNRNPDRTQGEPAEDRRGDNFPPRPEEPDDQQPGFRGQSGSQGQAGWQDPSRSIQDRPAGDQPPQNDERPPASPPGDSQALTSEERAQVKAILARYDPDTLTPEQARAIHEAFRQAGIKGGPAMAEAVREAGFDPEMLRRLAPPLNREGGRNPPPSRG